MDNQPNAIGFLFENAGAYVETRIDLLKLKAVSKSSDIMSSVISKLVILIFIFFATFILNIGLSIWLGALLGQLWYGFFMVGGFYLLLAILAIVFQNKWIKAPLNDILVKKILN